MQQYKVTLTDLRKAKIIEEAMYFSKYDDTYTPEEWKAYFNYIKQGNRLEETVTDFESFYFPKSVMIFFYSHVNDDGKVCRLEEVSLKDEFIKKNIYLFTRNNRDFVHYLIRNNEPLYFVDYDNTFVNEGKASFPKIKYIKEFNQKNNVVLCTSRSTNVFKEIVTSCGIEDNYTMSRGGAVIKKNEEIVSLTTLGESACDLIKDLEENGVDYICNYPNTCFIGHLTPESKEVLQKYREKDVIDKTPLDCTKVVSIFVINKDNNFDKVYEVIKKYDDLYINDFDKYIIGIYNKKVNKGTALRKIAELNNKYYRCSIGIGDSMNDYPMLELAGRSYVVYTATDELKQYNFETLVDDRDIDIVKVLKKYENRDLE